MHGLSLPRDAIESQRESENLRERLVCHVMKGLIGFDHLVKGRPELSYTQNEKNRCPQNASKTCSHERAIAHLSTLSNFLKSAQ